MSCELPKLAVKQAPYPKDVICLVETQVSSNLRGDVARFTICTARHDDKCGGMTKRPTARKCTLTLVQQERTATAQVCVNGLLSRKLAQSRSTLLRLLQMECMWKPCDNPNQTTLMHICTLEQGLCMHSVEPTCAQLLTSCAANTLRRLTRIVEHMHVGVDCFSRCSECAYQHTSVEAVWLQDLLKVFLVKPG